MCLTPGQSGDNSAGDFSLVCSPPRHLMGSFVLPFGCQPVVFVIGQNWVPICSIRFVSYYTPEALGHAGYRELTRGGLSEVRSLPGMPKRGRAQHHIGVCPGSGLETMQSLRQRLCPSAGPAPPPRPLAPSMPSGTNGASVPASSSVAALLNRRDAPVVRNLHRGSVAAAVAGLELHGADALVQDLVRDRVAKTSIAQATRTSNYGCISTAWCTRLSLHLPYGPSPSTR